MDGKLEPLPRIALPTPRNVNLLRKYPSVTVDIECGQSRPGRDFKWTAKSVRHARLKLLGLGCCEWGLSIIPGVHVEAYAAAKRLLADPNVVKVFQNGDWYDIPVLARHGVKVAGIIHDTRDARRALSATSELALGYLASLYTDADPWKQREGEEKGLAVDEKNIERTRVYNVKDVVYDARAWREMTTGRDSEKWRTERIQRLYEVHRKTARIAAKMHAVGIPVNRERYVFMKWALMEEYREKEAALLHAVAIRDFRCTPDHLRALIYRRHATGALAKYARFNLPDPLDPKMYSQGDMEKACSVGEDARIQLILDPSTPDELRQILKLYHAAARVWKRRSTFIASKLVRNAIDEHWWLHPGWNSAGTDTGRWSSSEPNVQNIEKDLRAMYMAPPGYLLVNADFKSQELHVNYCVTSDEVLGEGLRAPGSVYSADACEWFGHPPGTNVKELYPKQYKSCKIGHLAYQYGAGVATGHQQALKRDINFPWELSKKFHTDFRRRYSRTIEFWGEEMKRVMDTGYSETRILHRRRAYPRPPPPTEVNNFPIQGTAAEITTLSLIAADERLERECRTAHLVGQFHDALMVVCPEERGNQVVTILRECMEVEHVIEGKQHQFPVDVTVGQSWDEL